MSKQFVSCECVDTRKGVIFTPGGEKPVLILDLYAKSIDSHLVKYLNCEITGKNHRVSANSDFAKLYRLATGNNPSSRFSKAQQLLNHFLECRFVAEYEHARLKNGLAYLKATKVLPENPAVNDEWTPQGVLKKRRKTTPQTTTENGDEVAKEWRRSGEKVAKKWRENGDGKTLQDAKTLGLEPVFNPTKPLPTPSKTTNPLTQYPDDDFFLNYPPAEFECPDFEFEPAEFDCPEFPPVEFEPVESVYGCFDLGDDYDENAYGWMDAMIEKFPPFPSSSKVQ